MPNWCSCDLTLSGPQSALDDLCARLEGTRTETDGSPGDHTFSLLEAFLPMPDALHGTNSPSRPPYSDAQVQAETHHGTQRHMIDTIAEWQLTRDDTIAQTGFDNWYDWSVQTWGTKWSDTASGYTRRARSVTLSVETPWGPPLQGLVTISQRSPLTIRCRWYEGGMGEQGVLVIKGGIVLRETSQRYRGGRGG